MSETSETAEKHLKYQSVLTVIKRMWVIEVKFVPTMIVCVTKLLKEQSRRNPGNHNFLELQRTQYSKSKNVHSKVYEDI